MISDKIRSAEKAISRLRVMRSFHLKHFDAYTIDSYQGQEADVVIFSPVRSNNAQDSSIGHTGDFRRINVAVSRAKRGLIIAGSSSTLTMHSKVSLQRGGECVPNYWKK